jgi:hypothetical protein
LLRRLIAGEQVIQCLQKADGVIKVWVITDSSLTINHRFQFF